MLLSLRSADWKQLRVLADQLSGEAPPPCERAPDGMDGDVWTACRGAYWLFRCVRRWHEFGDSLRKRHPLLETHEWGGEPMRWWLYESEYRKVYGDADPDWPRMAGLLLALHAWDPAKYPCVGELQMACFLAWDLREALKWGLAIVARAGCAGLERRLRREWRVLRDSAEAGGRYAPDRLVTSAGERRFMFTERGFSLLV